MRSRGRFYEDGPYTCCDNADVHPQPCLCAAPDLEPLRHEALDELIRADYLVILDGEHGDSP